MSVCVGQLTQQRKWARGHFSFFCVEIALIAVRAKREEENFLGPLYINDRKNRDVPYSRVSDLQSQSREPKRRSGNASDD